MKTPPLWTSLLAVAALSFSSALLLAPLVEAAYRGEASALAGTVRTGVWLLAATAPLLALAKGAVVAAIGWAVLTLGGGHPPFRRLLDIGVAAEAILVAQGLWLAVLLRVRGVGGIGSPADLGVPTGLDLLFPDPTTVAGGIATAVTPFHLAWALFLGVAVLPFAQGRRGLAGVVAVACWLPAPFLAVVRGGLG